MPPIVDMGAYEYQAPLIPALSEWGLAAMTVALLIAGTLVIHRGRRGHRLPTYCRVFGGAFFGLGAFSASVAAQVQVGPQIRIDLNGGTAQAHETSIASSNRNPNEIVAAWNDWREVADPGSFRVVVAVSSDGGATWGHWVISPPPAFQGGNAVQYDPMTAYDGRTGTLWVGALSHSGAAMGVFVARKIPGENELEASVMATSTSGLPDKGWMAAGPSHTDPNATSVYIGFNRGLLASQNMGTHWTLIGPLLPPDAGALGFLPRVGPQASGCWVLMMKNLLRRFSENAT